MSRLFTRFMITAVFTGASAQAMAQSVSPALAQQVIGFTRPDFVTVAPPPPPKDPTFCTANDKAAHIAALQAQIAVSNTNFATARAYTEKLDARIKALQAAEGLNPRAIDVVRAEMADFDKPYMDMYRGGRALAVRLEAADKAAVVACPGAASPQIAAAPTPIAPAAPVVAVVAARPAPVTPLPPAPVRPVQSAAVQVQPAPVAAARPAEPVAAPPPTGTASPAPAPKPSLIRETPWLAVMPPAPAVKPVDLAVLAAPPAPRAPSTPIVAAPVAEPPPRTLPQPQPQPLPVLAEGEGVLPPRTVFWRTRGAKGETLAVQVTLAPKWELGRRFVLDWSGKTRGGYDFKPVSGDWTTRPADLDRKPDLFVSYVIVTLDTGRTFYMKRPDMVARAGLSVATSSRIFLPDDGKVRKIEIVFGRHSEAATAVWEFG